MYTENTGDIDGVTILQGSDIYFNYALRQYRLCHDLAASSNMMDCSALIKLDDSAVEFRKLSRFGATLAEKVATVWCGTCGMFYRNLGKLCNGKDPSTILKTIAGNACGLSKDFKHLADASNDLAAKFKTLGSAMPAIQDVFVQAFQEEEHRAAIVEREKQQKLEETRRMSAAVMEENRSQNKSWCSRIVYVVPGLVVKLSGRCVGAEKLDSAQELEEKSEIELKEAQEKLKKQTDHRKKAEVQHLN